jgi:ribosome-associated toxin RatA of RatAB toxin-antitoxin module
VKTVDEQIARAPADLCWQVAADVERWPEILPHYRWVRFVRKDGFASGVVEMAAFRDFGPARWPTWWMSEMRCDAERRTVRYRHVDGITRGMDVVWEVCPLADDLSHLRIVHTWTGPDWPLIGEIAANAVIGPHFVSAIAGRTLAGVAREAERRAVLRHDAGGTSSLHPEAADGGEGR